MKWLESCVDFGVLKDMTDSHNSQEPTLRWPTPWPNLNKPDNKLQNMDHSEKYMESLFSTVEGFQDDIEDDSVIMDLYRTSMFELLMFNSIDSDGEL